MKMAYRFISGHFQHIHDMRRLRNGIAIFTHRAEVKFDRFLDQAFRFVQRKAERHAAGKVGDIRTPSVR